jgi:hypothetical protein
MDIGGDMKSYKRKPGWRVRKSNSWPWMIGVSVVKLGWKDKFNSPRHEWNPKVTFHFGWKVIIFEQGNGDYWEKWLWIWKYNQGNEKKAKRTWEWRDENGKSTWFKDEED